MSTAPPAEYFLRTTGLSRPSCTWLHEHYRRFADPKTGAVLVECVSVYEDGFAYLSAHTQFPVPAQAVPSTAEAYAAARYKALRSMAQRRAQQRAEKALRKREEDMRRGLAGLAKAVQPAAAPAVVAERAEAPALAEIVRQPARLAPEPVAAPLPGLLEDFTVIDTEFVPEGPHLLEVAAIRYLNQEPREAFVSFVAFSGYVPRFVTDLTGITALHLDGAPSEKKVLGELRKYVGDSLLVCHNVPADRGVIEKVRARLGATAELSNAWLCTMALARRLSKAGLLPQTLKFGLADLCQHFGIKRRGEHRAKADVLMTFQVLRKLHELQPVTKHDLHGAPQPGKAKKSTVPAGPGLFAAA
jgi:DNA polymerase III epsilon subunit-like protein